MKYSEFETEVEKMGYEVSILENYIYIGKNNRTYAKVSKTSRYVIDTHYGSFLALYESDAFKIYEACMMLTETPLAEREGEKLYRVKFPNVTRSGNSIYLEKKQSSKDNVGVDWSHEDFIFEEPHSYTFTEQEIKDIDERYLAFKVEVKDE